jgi:hypothetical protein
VYSGLDNRSVTQLLWSLVVVHCCCSQSCLVFSGDQLSWLLLASPFLVILVMSPFHMVIGFLYDIFLWRFSLWPFQPFIFPIVYNSDMRCPTWETQTEMTCNMVLLFNFLDDV